MLKKTDYLKQKEYEIIEKDNGCRDYKFKNFKSTLLLLKFNNNSRSVCYSDKKEFTMITPFSPKNKKENRILAYLSIGELVHIANFSDKYEYFIKYCKIIKHSNSRYIRYLKQNINKAKYIQPVIMQGIYKDGITSDCLISRSSFCICLLHKKDNEKLYENKELFNEFYLQMQKTAAASGICYDNSGIFFILHISDMNNTLRDRSIQFADKHFVFFIEYLKDLFNKRYKKYNAIIKIQNAMYIPKQSVRIYLNRNLKGFYIQDAK